MAQNKKTHVWREGLPNVPTYYKEVPRKPRVKYTVVADGEKLEYWECPNCYELITTWKPEYCPRCGQHLDWTAE